jgi:hypothetical protein
MERVYRSMPSEKIFFLFFISPNRPKMSRKIPDAREKLLIIHPSSIASALNSLPIAGSARIMEDAKKAGRNEAKFATIRTDLLNDFSSLET